MSKQKIAIKQEETTELSNLIKNGKSLLVFEYLGINAVELTALRKKLFKSQAKMLVVKNNILSRALKEAQVSQAPELVGPNAIIISKGDEIVPFKEIDELAKKHKFINFKYGLLEGSVVEKKNLSAIANIPGRSGLLSMLLSCLQASITKLACGIKSVGEKK